VWASMKSGMTKSLQPSHDPPAKYGRPC
jgi:hypothetical protein